MRANQTRTTHWRPSLEAKHVTCVCRAHVMICYVMLCYVILYYVMLCYVMKAVAAYNKDRARENKFRSKAIRNDTSTIHSTSFYPGLFLVPPDTL